MPQTEISHLLSKSFVCVNSLRDSKNASYKISFGHDWVISHFTVCITAVLFDSSKQNINIPNVHFCAPIFLRDRGWTPPHICPHLEGRLWGREACTVAAKRIKNLATFFCFTAWDKERQYCPLGEEIFMVTRKAAGTGGHAGLYLVSVKPNLSFKINDHAAILVSQNVSARFAPIAWKI